MAAKSRGAQHLPKGRWVPAAFPVVIQGFVADLLWRFLHLEKVKFVLGKTQLPIEVDGGVNAETASYAKGVGVTRFVTTSYLFGNPKPEEQFKALQKTLGIPEKE